MIESKTVQGRPFLVASLLAVGLVAVTPHLPTLRAGFTYDDRDFVVSNASIRRLSTAVGAFLSPFPPEQPKRGLFRPVTNLSYAVDYALFRDRAGGFHATNIAIYAIVCAGVLMVARRLLSAPRALVASLLFAAHAVHTEAVDSISGRSELLSLAFGLAALLCAERVEKTGRRRWLAATLTCLALAMFCKETGMMAVVVLGAYLWIVRRSPRLRSLGAAMVSVCIGYLALRVWALGRTLPDAHAGGGGLLARISLMAAVYLENLRLMFFPLRLDIDYFYQHRLHDIHPARAILGAIGILATLCGSLWLVIRSRGNPKLATAAFASVVFVAYLLPTSHLVPFGAVLAERFLLAPTLGLVLLLLAFVPRLSVPWTSAFVAAIALLSLRSYGRAREWHDSVTLFGRTAMQVPDDPRVETNLAYGFIERGDPKAAITHLRRALALDPASSAALNNLGYLLMSAGDHEQARATFMRMIALDPDSASAFNNLGVIATRTNQYPQARSYYRRALAINPNYQSARENLASVEMALGRAAAHLRDRQNSIAQSQDAREWLTYARACQTVGDLDCARRGYARAKAIEPTLTPDPALERLGAAPAE